ncbi:MULTISPECIES: ATP-binding protein [unclassified Chelatococcus]|uniref:ATP-binding protein n=1 Tax=unclassified Chelatococcus TaxID=2638111 RepID=UPI001BCD0D27|nr:MULTISPECIES: ATP-binding protein [unclassified Chelatococcus]CAH1659760.1 AAA domain-containing protein [Hyphomicrobiales bacterium]MBS7740984.1 ATP-binding protein [Chelatococcus sp. HY11]MBX3545170.1 ATP-binding protein [Chelatococcus sp.]MCO5077803.1 ATP-binding protein [Chelatococcus sp.]CAH1683708.1 AAA domain-containing protein [Hyphomicrobiales bacterium]
MKVNIDMGAAAGGAVADLDLEELLATRLLVQGNSGSGKSHLLRRLLEQSAPWVQQCIIDPEGDFVTLAEKFGHQVVDAARTEAELARIASRVRQHRVSVVLNLEGLDIEQQMRAAAAFLGGMFDTERDYWYPVLVVVDEAQLFAPAVAGEVSDETRKLSLGAMTNLMCRGRKRGLAGVIATQRLAKLAKNVAAEASNFLMGRTFLDIDMARAADLLGMERRQAEMFRELARGRFIALGPALSRRPLAITIGSVETSARSASPKLMPLPDAPEDVRDLIFTPGPEEASQVVRKPPPKPIPTADILTQLSRPRPAPEPPAEPVFAIIDEAEREAGIDTVLREILEDPDAAFRSDAVLYQDFLVRSRIRRVPGEPLQLPAFRRRLAVAKAGVDESAGGEAWAMALSLSEGLPDDLQGMFLMIARAATNKDPCPSDATLARAYGSHSPRRVRRLLTYFEERGLLVTRMDFHGRRVLAFPDLGCETAPGDPDGPDEAQRDAAE